MVREVYQCEVCGVVGEDKNERKIHEKIPLTGMVLMEGDVMGLNRETFTAHDCYVAVVKFETCPDKNHLRMYGFGVFRFYNEDSGFQENIELGVHYSSKFPTLEDDFVELSEEDFREFLEFRGRKGEIESAGVSFKDYYKRIHSKIRLRRWVTGGS